MDDILNKRGDVGTIQRGKERKRKKTVELAKEKESVVIGEDSSSHNPDVNNYVVVEEDVVSSVVVEGKKNVELLTCDVCPVVVPDRL